MMMLRRLCLILVMLAMLPWGAWLGGNGLSRVAPVAMAVEADVAVTDATPAVNGMACLLPGGACTPDVLLNAALALAPAPAPRRITVRFVPPIWRNPPPRLPRRPPCLA